MKIVAISGFTEDSVGTNGSAGAGKDTLADFIAEDCNGVSISLADPLKRYCYEVYDFSEQQLWGPSAFRNAPDKRYPRPGPQGEAARIAYGLAEGWGNPETRAKSLAEWGPLGWLTPRHALQTLGTEWGRENYENTWVNALKITADRLSQGGLSYSKVEGLSRSDADTPDYVVVPDLRFPGELEAFKSFGATTVRVKRKANTLIGAASQHISETALLSTPDSEFDLILDNNGSMDDLRSLVAKNFGEH